MRGGARSRAGRLAAGAVLVAAAAALPGCGPGPADPSAPVPQFTVGAMTFEVVSGGVYRGDGLLRVYLTDQIDTCAAVDFVPQRLATYLAFTVAPPAAAPLTATVLVNEAGPSAGQATGTLVQRTGGVQTGASYVAASGALTWSGGATGDLTLEALDAGFTGAAGRVALDGLRLAACN